MGRRRTRLAAIPAAGLALLAGLMSPAAAGPARAQGTPDPDGPAAATATVRLITGDEVTVSTGSGGRRVAGIEPGPGRKGIPFRTLEENGRLTVLPADAAPLVAAGRLDQALFDVTGLVEQEYDTAHVDALPLIVADSPDEKAPARRELSAFADEGSTVRELPSIGGRAVRVEDDRLGAFWKSLVADAGRGTARQAAPAAPQVWLDRRVEAALDRSTAQIGAPQAWKSGLKGKGVKVAVLDTGVDTSHPDLKGRVRESVDFSDSASTADRVGHGTHVASIIAGSGAASGGRYQGVAPEAELISGKVLNDQGVGADSQIIAGMEWAVARGAKVVNMSLGADVPTDGTDPLSLALNRLTRSSGALFVVAAGNSGAGGELTVGAPAAADESLAVGAVDRDGSLAPFSSRGPRWGDSAVKPDLTAPGVGIVAARAAGTSMASPVNQWYTAANGTSMATPHVAGAAALLAQQHPDWDHRALKDALISTSVRAKGQKTVEQGGGRVDLAGALGGVTGTGSLAFGEIADDAKAPRTETLRYTNTTRKDVTLDLAVSWADAEGGKLSAAALKPGTKSVRVPAGASVGVPLTLQPSKVKQGAYYGYVTATSKDGKVAVHTTLGLLKRGPVHKLTVRAKGMDGRLTPAQVGWGHGLLVWFDPETGSAEVEEGTYHASALVMDQTRGTEIRELVAPEIEVTKDTVVTLDAREARPVEIVTPKPAEQRGIISYQHHRQLDGRSLLQGTMYFDSVKALYVTPTPKVKRGTYEFATRWQLVAPLLEATVTGAGGGRLDAYYMPDSPLLDERGVTLPVVDGRDGSAAALRNVRGKAVLVDDPSGSGGRDAAERAAAAGAAAVLLIHFEDNAWTRWTPTGDRLPLPVIRLGRTEGEGLQDRVARQSVQVRFTGTARSPYLYDVMAVFPQRVPDRIRHEVSESSSAVVKATYTDNGGPGWQTEQRFAWRPYQDTAWNQTSRFVPSGVERTEYVTAGDTLWRHVVLHESPSDLDAVLSAGAEDTPRAYAARAKVSERWNGAVVRPAIPADTGTPTVRLHDVLRLRVPEFTDGEGHPGRRMVVWDGGIGARQPASDEVSAELYRSGKRVAVLDDAWQDVEVPSGSAEFRLDLRTRRTSDAWRYASSTQTSWTFRSGTTAEAAPLGLLQLDYRVPVDNANSLVSGGAYDVTVAVRAQRGLPAPKGVRTTVEMSYDDGRTWHTAQVRDRGGNTFQATANRPSSVRGDAPVTLRVTATDSSGASVRQTVHRAFLLRR